MFHRILKCKKKYNLYEIWSPHTEWGTLLWKKMRSSFWFLRAFLDAALHQCWSCFYPCPCKDFPLQIGCSTWNKQRCIARAGILRTHQKWPQMVPQLPSGIKISTLPFGWADIRTPPPWTGEKNAVATFCDLISYPNNCFGSFWFSILNANQHYHWRNCNLPQKYSNDTLSPVLPAGSTPDSTCALNILKYYI